MTNWWKNAGAANFTRGLTNLTGQLSNNLKDILTEASEETFDPSTELERARQKIEELEFSRQTLIEECTTLKKQCDELSMQKQAAEIKSDMLLAESRRNIEAKENELKQLRENTNSTSWNTINTGNNTWTDILEDDQPEIGEYLKYQKSIRDLKDENQHLRDELVNLRKSSKNQRNDRTQQRREEEILQIQSAFTEQISKLRQDYETKLSESQQKIEELEKKLEIHQENQINKIEESQNEKNQLEKELISQELEQANNKLNSLNQKLKEFLDLEKNFDLIKLKNKELENHLKKFEIEHELNLKSIDEQKQIVEQLNETIDQLKSKKEKFDRDQQTDSEKDPVRLLSEERERCDALVADNDKMCLLIETTRNELNKFGAKIQIQQENLDEKEKIIENFNEKFITQEQINRNLRNELDQQEETNRNFKIEKENFLKEIEMKIKSIDEQKFEIEILNRENEKFHQENLLLISQIEREKNLYEQEKRENEENREKESNRREKLEQQLTNLNDDLQILENEKNDLHSEIERLKDQIEKKDRTIKSFENSTLTPGSPSVVTLPAEVRTRSPSPEMFEHVLELEAQNLRQEQILQEIQSIYERFRNLLPTSLLENEREQSMLLSERFVNLFEQWSIYLDTLSIVQQESESIKQLLIEKQDEIVKLQSELELTNNRLIEIEQNSSINLNKDQQFDEQQNEEEIEKILELHPFPLRAPSRQSIISSTPGEKQQLIAQNELLSSLLAEKDRELISLQQAEKNREEIFKTIENLKASLQQMELDKEIKQVELNDIRNVLDEKLRENSSLKKEKMNFIETLAELERERQEQQSIIQILPKQSIVEDEKQNRNVENQTNENVKDPEIGEKYEKLRGEFDKLVEFSKKQHEDSMSYYNEYNRIVLLYNELNSKHSQTQVEYESLQSLIQQKTEAYLQSQNELSNFQNLFYHEKKKSEEFDVLRSKLIEKDEKLREYLDNETKFLFKQSELERQLKIFEQNIFELKSNEQHLIEQLQNNDLEQFQSELKRLKDERDFILTEKKQIEENLDSFRQKTNQSDERERKLSNEIERLRNHLIKMEETYTNDLITAEDREKTLRNQIAQLQDTNRGQFELIQQLNTSGEQSKQTLATELGTLKYEFSKLETTNNRLNEQLQYQMKCSQNLQNVLDQFKREREQHINDHLRQYQQTIREQTKILQNLTDENNQFRSRLSEYDEALAAARRLNEQMEKKENFFQSMKNQIEENERKIHQYELNLKDLQSTSGSRIEKQLVKNILLSYFHTPVDKRQEVVPLLGALVGFTQEEYRKAIDATSTNNTGKNSASPSWLSGWLTGNSSNNQSQSARARTQSESPAYDPNKSFTELLIQYVDQQSANNSKFPAARFNTEEYLQRHDQNSQTIHPNLARKLNQSANNNPFLNSFHLPTNRPASAIVLPTSATLNDASIPYPSPVSTSSSSSSSNSTTDQSSSTILKDLLKS